MFDLAKEPGNKTRVSALKTEMGIKDTFLNAFLDQIFLAMSGERVDVAKKAVADAEVARMPSDKARIFSPVWQIKGTYPSVIVF